MADPLDDPQAAPDAAGAPAAQPAAFQPTGLVTGPLITPPGDTTDLDVPSDNFEAFDPLRDSKDVSAYLERHGYMHGGPTGFLQNTPLPAGKGVAPQWSPAPTLTAEQANDQYGIKGHLTFDGDIPIAAAKSLYDQQVAYLKRQEILARQQGGAFNRIAQFGVGALNMALDPIDAASAFIPVVGEARYAGWLAKASGGFSRGAIRFGVGAAQGAIAQAPISALRFGLSYENQQDYSAVEALVDIAFGGIAGGGLHAVGGSIADALSGKYRTRVAAMASTAIPRMVDDAPLDVKGAALRTAVAQAVQNQPVEVRPFFEGRAAAAEPEAAPPAEAPPIPPTPERGSPESAAQAVIDPWGGNPPRTPEELRLAVERLNEKVAEFKTAGLDNVAALFEEKLRALGYEPGEGTPAALSAAGEATGAPISSSTETPPGTQAPALGDQVSTRPAPEGSSTTRENAPSILQGPNATRTLGDMDAATNRKIIQASSDLKALHSFALSIVPQVNAKLRDLVREVPGAELVGMRPKDLPGLEEKAKNRPPETISDYIGGRIAVDDPAALQGVLDKLRENGRLLEVEDFLGSEAKGGYRAVHVQFDLGNGMSAELQLVPRELLKAQIEAHAVRQPFKRLAEKKDLTVKELAAVKGADAKSRAIFDKAWKPIASKWGYGGEAEKGATIAAKFIKNDVAVLPGGAEFKVRYAIVDAKDLVASQLPSFEANPKYPAALQPRDRTRSASAVQVRDIAQKMNPKLLGENPNASDGAPIVGPDGVVESGNGRVMAINMAYAEKMPTAGKYKAYLAEQGYPIDHLEEPVLVRIRDQAMSDEERAAFGRQANQRTTLAMGTAEEAKADAAALPDHVLELHRGGDVGSAGNREFVTAFNRDVVGPNDRAAMMDKDGALTVKGRQRIEAAILAKAYDDPGILAALLEDPESNIKAIGRAITEVSPRWALMRKEASRGEINPKVDITKDLLDAVNLVRQARDKGIKVNDLVTQDDMFGGKISPEAEAILNLFFRPVEKKGEVPFTKPRAMDKIAARLDKYVEEARKSQGGPGLFGGEDVVTPQEILSRAGRKGQAGEQADIFGQPRRSAGAGEGDLGGPAGGSGEPGGGASPLGQTPANDSLGHALRAQADPNSGFADPEDLRGQAAAAAFAKEPKPSAGGDEASSPDVSAIEAAMAPDLERLDAALKAGQVSKEDAAGLGEADKMLADAEGRAQGIEAAATCLGRGV